MSNGVKIAIGFLLFMISAVFLFMINADNTGDAGKPELYLFPAIPAVIGLPLLLSGLIFKIDDRFKHVIIKKATPNNIYIGLGITIASIAILYLFYNVLHIAPLIVAIGSLIGVPVGLIIMGSVYSEGCAECGSVLSSNCKILEEISFREDLPPNLDFAETDVICFSYCPTCSNFIKIKRGKDQHLIQGEYANTIHAHLLLMETS